MAKAVSIDSFAGIHSGETKPPIGSAESLSNVARHKTRGQLELIEGFEQRALAATFGGSFTVPTYSASVTLQTPIALGSFFVPDHGGRSITALFVNNTRESTGFTGPRDTLSNLAIYIRPYWSGAAWVDAWQELTEFYIFKISTFVGSTITIVNTATDDLTFMNTNALAGFVAFHGNDFTTTTQNGILVTGSDGAAATITVDPTAANLSTWVADQKLYVTRSNLGRFLPQSSTANIRSLLDELRITTGNGTTDGTAAAFFRTKTFAWTGAHSLDKVYAEYAQLEVPSNAFKLSELTAVENLTAPIPSGTYDLRASLVLDDGQETELRSMNGTMSAYLAKKLTASGYTLSTVVGSFTQGGGYLYALTDAPASAILQINPADLSVVQVSFLPVGYLALAIAFGSGHPVVVGQNSTNLLKRALFIGDPATMVFTISSAGEQTGTRAIYSYWGKVSAQQNSSSLFTLITDGALSTYIEKWDLITGGWSEVAIATANAAGYGHVCGVNSTHVFISVDNGTRQIVKFTVALGGEAAITLTGAAASPTQGRIQGTYVYVVAGVKLFRVDTTSSAITDWYALATGDGGITSDGTNIYAGDGATIKAIKISDASLVATIVTTGVIQVNLDFINTNEIMSFESVTGILRDYTYSAAQSQIISNGNISLSYKVWISPSLISRRARYVRVYIQRDSGGFYELANVGLYTGETTFSAAAWDATLQHWFAVMSTANTITGTTVSGAVNQSIRNLGRTDSDTGVLKHTFAVTANSTTYAVGVVAASKTMRNKVFTSPVSSSGISQYDVLPNDAATILDVEFNDGDEAKALIGVSDRVLVLKNRSAVLLTLTSTGEHTRDIVATGAGVASVGTIGSFNDVAFWLDHSGVYEFSTRGIRPISDAILPDILALSDAQRAAAIAVCDSKYLQYILLVAGVMYIYDIKDGEWTMRTPHANPAAFSIDTSNQRYMILMPTTGGVIWPTTASQQMGAAISFNWMSSKIEIDLPRGMDALLSGFWVEYDSPVPITLSWYLDNSGSTAGTYALLAANKYALVPASLSARCRTFKLKLGGATTAANQVVKIKRLGAWYYTIPAGGDIQVAA